MSHSYFRETGYYLKDLLGRGLIEAWDSPLRTCQWDAQNIKHIPYLDLSRLNIDSLLERYQEGLGWRKKSTGYYYFKVEFSSTSKILTTIILPELWRIARKQRGVGYVRGMVFLGGARAARHLSTEEIIAIPIYAHPANVWSVSRVNNGKVSQAEGFNGNRRVFVQLHTLEKEHNDAKAYPEGGLFSRW